MPRAVMAATPAGYTAHLAGFHCCFQRACFDSGLLNPVRASWSVLLAQFSGRGSAYPRARASVQALRTMASWRVSPPLCCNAMLSCAWNKQAYWKARSTQVQRLQSFVPRFSAWSRLQGSFHVIYRLRKRLTLCLGASVTRKSGLCIA